jgi:NADH-quinone oxidoreductase subunit C
VVELSDTTETTEAPALPGDGLRESIVDDLRRHIGDGLIEHVLKPQDDLWIRVATDKWADTGRALRAMGFEYFCFLSAIDWLPSPFGKSEEGEARDPEQVRQAIEDGLRRMEHGVTGGETRFQLLARVYSIARRTGIVFKADLPDDGPVAETWSGVYAGANWMERETHEMYGIGFAGHPYLVNLYLPGAFEGHPLRKDFPLLAREVKPWPGLVDVEPMPGEPNEPEEPAAAGAEA